MLTYWMMFLMPLLGAISPRVMAKSQGTVMFAAVCAIYVVLIGLRFEVGGDWSNYLPMFQYMETLDFWEVLTGFKSPGYSVLNWSVAQLGGNIYVVNTICSAIMMAGIFRFCRSMPNPWLALLVAVPYLIIVVGMGYTRQAVAIGVAMGGLVSLGKGRLVPFAISVVIAALFHSSAILLVTIAGLATSNRRIWSIIWVAAATAVGYVVLLQSDSDAMWRNYVTAEMESYGAIQRVLMNVVAAALLLVYRRRFTQEMQLRRLWIIFCFLSIVCLPLVFLASTAVDRMALYLIPLQLFVFSRVPTLTGNATARTAIVALVAIYYACVQFVWLNYAVQREAWVPYQFAPFEE